MVATITGTKVMGYGGDYSAEERNYSITFIVETTNTTDGVVAVMAAPGLPRLLTSWYDTGSENDAAAICQRLTPRQVGKFDWEVTASYSTKPFQSNATGQPPEQMEPNPLLRPLTWTFEGRQKQKVLRIDLNGRAFLNSAGAPFSAEVATVDVAVGLLRIIKNEPYPNFALWHDFSNKLNEFQFWMAPAKTARMLPPKASPQYESGISYVRVEYEFEIDPDGWQRKEVDKGPYYFVNNATTDETQKRYPSDGNGQTSTEEVLLNGYGGKLPKADIDANRRVLAVFDVYQTRDFSELRLG